MTFREGICIALVVAFGNLIGTSAVAGWLWYRQDHLGQLLNADRTQIVQELNVMAARIQSLEQQTKTLKK
jgi:hypothetical protein